MTKKEAHIKSKTDLHNAKKKTFAKILPTAKKVDLQPYVNIVAGLLQISVPEATNSITSGDVSVNNNLVLDPAYVLKSGDLVRAETGHIVSGSPYVCIIK